MCLQIKSYENISGRIKACQKDGWRLHTYQAIGTSGNPTHYLLFEKGD